MTNAFVPARAAGLAIRIAAFCMAAVLGALFALPASAQFSPEQADALARINAYFNSVRTMEGEFIQVGPNGEQSEGVFFLARPGKVRFQYKPPVRLLVVSDGRSVAIEDNTANTQDMYPLSRTPLRHLLADRIDLTSAAIVREVRMEPDLISVVLQEESMGDGWLTLIFDAKTYELRQWITTDAQGLNTSVAVFNVAVNKPEDRSKFRIYLRNQQAPQ